MEIRDDALEKEKKKVVREKKVDVNRLAPTSGRLGRASLVTPGTTEERVWGEGRSDKRRFRFGGRLGIKIKLVTGYWTRCRIIGQHGTKCNCT